MLPSEWRQLVEKSLILLFMIAGLSDARNPLKALQRLRQDPDSTEFVYLRPFRLDETMPINPYHLEIVSHAEIDEVSFEAGLFLLYC